MHPFRLGEEAVDRRPVGDVQPMPGRARPEVQDAYVARVQQALSGTVYNAGGCASYYRDVNGRNSFNWPWSTTALINNVSTFDPAAFATEYAAQEASA